MAIKIRLSKRSGFFKEGGDVFIDSLIGGKLFCLFDLLEEKKEELGLQRLWIQLFYGGVSSPAERIPADGAFHRALRRYEGESGRVFRRRIPKREERGVKKPALSHRGLEKRLGNPVRARNHSIKPDLDGKLVPAFVAPAGNDPLAILAPLSN